MAKKIIDNTKKASRRALIASIIFAVVCAAFILILIFDNLKQITPPLPYLMLGAAVLPVALQIINICRIKKRWVSEVVFWFSLLYFAAVFCIMAYAMSKFWLFFTEIVPFVVAAFLICMLCWYFRAVHYTNKKRRIIGAVTIVGVVLTIIYYIFDIHPFYMTSGAVVFAVEDEYQIAWSTSVNSTGYVVVGDNTYYDAEAGTYDIEKSHKISVPMDELDAAGGYIIYSRALYHPWAYLSINGGTLSKEYSFRPVDTTDGFQIYNISDNHEINTGAAKAAGYWGESLDLLIVNGDVINDVSSDFQIAYLYRLINKITNGSIPTICTRGNHEANGSMVDELSDYIASYDDKFYYTVKLGNVWFLVLDTCSDHQDDEVLVSGSANYYPYKLEETEWLQTVVDGEEYNAADIEYRFVVSHVGFTRKSGNNAENETKATWIELTNQMNIDLLIAGHSHKVRFYNVGDESLHDTNFAMLLGSVRNDDDWTGESGIDFEFSGTAIEIQNHNVTVAFTNSEKVKMAEYCYDTDANYWKETLYLYNSRP